MTNNDNSRRKDDARPAETLHWDAACSICAGAGTTFGKTCVCRAAEAKRLTLTDALRSAALQLLEHNAAAGACITIPGEPPLYVLVGAASAIGKLLPEATTASASDPDDLAHELLGKDAMLMWKKRALEAERNLAGALRALGAENGQTFMGEPVVLGNASTHPENLSIQTHEIDGSASAQAATDDVRNAALEEAAREISTCFARGGPPDDPHPDAVIYNQGVQSALEHVRALRTTPAQAVTEDSHDQ